MEAGGGEIDPRVARTRRDVLEATSALLVADGWDAVTHAEVARRAGYSKATLYAHWPTRLDLIREAIGRICDAADHPPSTGHLREDLHASLADFAADLTEGHLDRLLAGVVERAAQGDVVTALRRRLYDAGTGGLRAILEAHLAPEHIDVPLAMLTGGVLVRVTFEGRPATPEFLDDLIERVLAPTGAGS